MTFPSDFVHVGISQLPQQLTESSRLESPREPLDLGISKATNPMDPGSPCQMMIGVYNHLPNARPLPFSEGEPGSLGKHLPNHHFSGDKILVFFVGDVIFPLGIHLTLSTRCFGCFFVLFRPQWCFFSPRKSGKSPQNGLPPFGFFLPLEFNKTYSHSQTPFFHEFPGRSFCRGLGMNDVFFGKTKTVSSWVFF